MVLEAEAVLESTVAAVVSFKEAAVSSGKAPILVNLPPVSLSRSEGAFGIGTAAQGNRRQKRSEKDKRERLEYPSLAVGSTMKAQRNLRVLKEFDRMSVLDPDTKIRA